MNAFREYRRRQKYRMCVIDEIHDQLGRATPFDEAKVRPSRKRYLLKLFKYKRRAQGISLSRN
ncbi:hypothetical protein DM819_21635 [Pseudomonas hunanensis]|uniref:Uncharacterized protein n=1 Tax=Pseudomonas hunanensis TaxID=1247546 RepID=A0ABD6N3H8_9PSED|nr:hypothetical protein [Pseudomonas hunanensis]